MGPTSESIRKCSPKTLDEWREYYFKNVKPKEHIEELGKKLYVKITEVIQSEVAEVTEQDCIEYMMQLVINRTFDGYITEIQTIYGQLQNIKSGIQLPEIFKEYNLQAETHKKFTEVFGGKVFYLFSAKVGDKKEIQNKEVIDEILKEIKHLTDMRK